MWSPKLQALDTGSLACGSRPRCRSTLSCNLTPYRSHLRGKRRTCPLPMNHHPLRYSSYPYTSTWSFFLSHSRLSHPQCPWKWIQTTHQCQRIASWASNHRTEANQTCSLPHQRTVSVLSPHAWFSPWRWSLRFRFHSSGTVSAKSVYVGSLTFSQPSWRIGKCWALLTNGSW